ncbi:MAG TPA: Bor family protein [Longimicrobiales bacterium]|nr:Bor family protein [Longimicrobiales bacterium]
MRRTILAALFVIVLPGCYHATVNTGRTPGSETHEIKWAHSFILGLVKPKTVDAMEECRGGVARVETRLSFLNQLVAGLTSGIYTPMRITVTCARDGRRMEDGLAVVDSPEAFRAALDAGEPFYVTLD